MASPERSQRIRAMEYIFRGAEVLAVGLALIGLAAAGVGLLEGKLSDVKSFGLSTATFSILAGGYFTQKSNLLPGKTLIRQGLNLA